MDGGVRGGDAGDEGAVGDHAVHRAEDGRPQPAAVDVAMGVVDLGPPDAPGPRASAASVMWSGYVLRVASTAASSGVSRRRRAGASR